jgi:hypothetical protein
MSDKSTLDKDIVAVNDMLKESFPELSFHKNGFGNGFEGMKGCEGKGHVHLKIRSREGSLVVRSYFTNDRDDEIRNVLETVVSGRVIMKTPYERGYQIASDFEVVYS